MAKDASEYIVSKENMDFSNTDQHAPEKVMAFPDILPTDTVHCFPANQATILRRRIFSSILIIFFLCLQVYFLLPNSYRPWLAGLAAAGIVLSILVFAQSFLIASYRVALDYKRKEVVLRYQFQKIIIPFDNFDTREGKPDQAELLFKKYMKRGPPSDVRYLILDNVRDSACYQTTSNDLVSLDDFALLKEESQSIRNAYRGMPAEADKLDMEEDEMTRLVQVALLDKPAPEDPEKSKKQKKPKNIDEPSGKTYNK